MIYSRDLDGTNYTGFFKVSMHVGLVDSTLLNITQLKPSGLDEWSVEKSGQHLYAHYESLVTSEGQSAFFFFLLSLYEKKRSTSATATKSQV